MIIERNIPKDLLKGSSFSDNESVNNFIATVDIPEYIADRTDSKASK